MALLQQILYKVKIISVAGTPVNEIKDLETDSRKVKAGDCFIAVKGTIADGHSFIDAAITNGASVIICEVLPANLNHDIQYFVVENSAIAAGVMAHNFYGEISNKIKLVGVTGTNGKTTIATLLFKLFSPLGYKCGLLSTVQNQVAKKYCRNTYNS